MSESSLVSSMFARSISEMEEPELNEVHLSDGEECVIFTQNDLPNVAFPLMEDIRRQGKLTDVVLKVRISLI